MEMMEITKNVRRLLGSTLNVALGAGVVLGSSYLFSRIKEKQEIEARLDRMEQILDKLSGEEPKK